MSRQSPSFYSELKDTNNLFLGARIYPLTPVNLSASIRPVPKQMGFSPSSDGQYALLSQE